MPSDSPSLLDLFIPPPTDHRLPYDPEYEHRAVLADNFLNRPSTMALAGAIPAGLTGAVGYARNGLPGAGAGALTGAGLGLGAYAGDLLARNALRFEQQPWLRAALAGTGGLLGAWGGHSAGQALFPKKRVKQAIDWEETLKGIHHHLPAPNVRDYLAGGVAGGLAGWGANALRSTEGLSDQEQKRRKWLSILGGAGVGAVGTNLLMDRTRRLAANVVDPFNYGQNVKPPTGLGDALRSVWYGAVLDKPVPGEANVSKDHPLFGKTVDDPLLETYRSFSPEHEQSLTARRELFRRYLGTHSDSPSDYFHVRPDGTTAFKPEALQDNHPLLKNLAYSMGVGRGASDPDRQLPYDHKDEGPFGSVFGSHPFNPVSAGTIDDAGNHRVTRRLLDTWDFKIDPHERQDAHQRLKSLYDDWPEMNQSTVNNLLSVVGRHAFENTMRNQVPVFAQDFSLTYPPGHVRPSSIRPIP